MLKDNNTLNITTKKPDWITIREAVKVVKKLTTTKIKNSEIYRHALYGNILLSIYFQSPIILRKVQTSGHKVKLRPTESSLINRLCQLDKNCFLCGRNLVISTQGQYIFPAQRVMDTTLAGYEYVQVQRLLARTLCIPSPVTGAKNTNYGITVSLYGEIFQIFEKITWRERIKQQIMRLPENIAPDIDEQISDQRIKKYDHKGCFPLHDLPQDACFVIRYAELEKLIDILVKKKRSHPPQHGYPRHYLACSGLPANIMRLSAH